MQDFPDWATTSVIKLWRQLEDAERKHERDIFIYFTQVYGYSEEAAKEFCGESSPNSCIKLLGKLLEGEEMRSAWESLQRLNCNTLPKSDYYDRNVIKANFYKKPSRLSTSSALAEEIFIRGVRKAWIGPVGIEDKTLKQRNDLIKEIKITAGKLAFLLEDAGPAFDSFAMREAAKNRGDISHGEDKNLSTSEIVELTQDFPDRPGYLSATLVDLIESIPDITPPQLISRPGAVESDRAYFVRSLTNHCRQEFGQPLRSVVLATTITLFDDPNITERQIIRLAP